MIKVELTKNVFNQRGGGLFGLKPIQVLYIKHLKKEIAFRDGESNTEEKPSARPKKENRVIKLIKEVFWI